MTPSNTTEKYPKHTPPICPKPFTNMNGILGYGFPFTAALALILIWLCGYGNTNIQIPE
jgi:hypothetical protein